MGIVSYAIRNARLTLSIMFFFLIAGALAYQSIPKEAEPDIQIPIIYVSLDLPRHLARGFGTTACCVRSRRG